MRHIVNGEADSHVWRGILIRELTPADAPYHGSLVEVEVPAGTRHPVARSTKCETYYYCVRGQIAFEVGGEGGVLRPGDLLVVEPNEWYGYSADAPAVLLSFNVPPYDAGASEYRDDAVSTTAG
jgi:quercetin dioxygenase-like cupin family protein